YKKYMQDKRAQTFYQRMSAGDIDSGIDFTPLNCVPLACMTGTDDIFCTPQANLCISLLKLTLKITSKLKKQNVVLQSWVTGGKVLDLVLTVPFGQIRLKLKSFIRVDLPPV